MSAACRCRWCVPSPTRLIAAFSVGRARAFAGEPRSLVVEEGRKRFPSDSEAQVEALRAFDLHLPAESRPWV